MVNGTSRHSVLSLWGMTRNQAHIAHWRNATPDQVCAENAKIIAENTTIMQTTAALQDGLFPGIVLLLPSPALLGTQTPTGGLGAPGGPSTTEGGLPGGSNSPAQMSMPGGPAALLANLLGTGINPAQLQAALAVLAGTPVPSTSLPPPAASSHQISMAQATILSFSDTDVPGGIHDLVQGLVNFGQYILFSLAHPLNQKCLWSSAGTLKCATIHLGHQKESLLDLSQFVIQEDFLTESKWRTCVTPFLAMVTAAYHNLGVKLFMADHLDFLHSHSSFSKDFTAIWTFDIKIHLQFNQKPFLFPKNFWQTKLLMQVSKSNVIGSCRGSGMASVGLQRASPEGTPKDLATSRAWPQLMGCATGSPKCPRQGLGCEGLT
jgi:hypothetical protein